MAPPKIAFVVLVFLGWLQSANAQECVDLTVSLFGHEEPWTSTFGTTCADMASSHKAETFLKQISILPEDYVNLMVKAMADSDYAGGIQAGALTLILNVMTTVGPTHPDTECPSAMQVFGLTNPCREVDYELMTNYAQHLLGFTPLRADEVRYMRALPVPYLL